MTICKFENCKTIASYNVDGQKPLYCGVHRKHNMVDVKHKTCAESDCKTRPIFNIEGEKKALYCAKHRKHNMVDVKNKTCAEPNCKTIPTYNIEGEKKALYCAEHRKHNMVNVKDKTCAEPNCKTLPTFNIEGEKKALYCAEHRKHNMVNVKSKTCAELNCKKQPAYNIEGEKNALYCAKHRKHNMVNVISKTCAEPNCKTIPIFNIEGEKKALYCAEHRKHNMVDVKSKTCAEPNCKTIPIFNIEGEKNALYCAKHRKHNMVDVKHTTCKTPMCSMRIKEKYNGYCYFCFIHMFPDSPITRNYKTKEKEVVEDITKTFPQYTWISDKKVQDGCSRRRPDLLLDMGEQILIIEIDENQHTDYDCSCENKRLMEISQDLGHRPIIFIRFNPDEYYVGETKIQSCWEYDKKGLCKLKYIDEWNGRLMVLKQQIEYWSNPINKTNKTIEVIQLYFDNFEIDKI